MTVLDAEVAASDRRRDETMGVCPNVSTAPSQAGCCHPAAFFHGTSSFVSRSVPTANIPKTINIGLCQSMATAPTAQPGNSQARTERKLSFHAPVACSWAKMFVANPIAVATAGWHALRHEGRGLGRSNHALHSARSSLPSERATRPLGSGFTAVLGADRIQRANQPRTSKSCRLPTVPAPASPD